MGRRPRADAGGRTGRPAGPQAHDRDVRAGDSVFFFTSTGSAEAWLAAHPRVSGVVLTKEQALQLSIDIFGHLLDD
jgi:hypothetical protein